MITYWRLPVHEVTPLLVRLFPLCMTVYDLMGHGTRSVPPSRTRKVNAACGGGKTLMGSKQRPDWLAGVT
ncbi:hypothetical protein TNCV_4539401 [Trichonephila clavipes]|nr:hypothetical protein TNCV_4539401 [Trichonephila clavipes]